LVTTLTAAGAHVHSLTPRPDVPDLVFTANAGVVLDRKALLARFRHPERRREEPINEAAFQQMAANGLVDEIVRLPEGLVLEGAGDCIWDSARRLFWLGHGFRSDAAAAGAMTKTFGYSCVPLELNDPRFYHLDTALCALPCGGVLHHPGAFTPRALEILYANVAPYDRLVLDERDALLFAANAVAFGRTIIMSRCGATLRRRLDERGYRVFQSPLDAFLRSGGSACCLTLRLDHLSSIQAGELSRSASNAA
jgi:N-dimethylarginine dimethylaminohydrolase